MHDQRGGGLDDLARTLASEMPRRRALRVIAGAVAAVAGPACWRDPPRAASGRPLKHICDTRVAERGLEVLHRRRPTPASRRAVRATGRARRAAGARTGARPHDVLQPLRPPEVAAAAGGTAAPAPSLTTAAQGPASAASICCDAGVGLRRPGPRVLLRAARAAVPRRRHRLVLQARRRLLRRSLLRARPALLPGALPQQLPEGHAALRPHLLRHVPDAAATARAAARTRSAASATTAARRRARAAARGAAPPERSAAATTAARDRQLLRHRVLPGEPDVRDDRRGRRRAVRTRGSPAWAAPPSAARSGDVAVGDRCCPAANPNCNPCDPPCRTGEVCRDGFCLQV